MTVKRRKLSKGIRIKPNDQALEADGEITVYSSVVGEEGEQTLKAQLSSAEKVIVTKDQAQTLQNKTIDATSATGNNTLSADSGDIVYDDTTQPVSSLGTDVQSALDAVKVALDGQNEASEIGYTPTTGADWVDPDPTNVKGALDQAASRITQNESDISTNGTAISDHLADTVDAHDASAISNVPAGNLAATDVQGALDELQSDVDTRALANLGTITNASIQTPSRLDTKQDTEANLITYALTASDGQFVFATDTQKMYQIIDNELAAVGGGGATAFEINQVAHGFAIGEGIYHNGTTWAKSQADDADTLAYYVVIEVADVDNFVAADFGRIEAVAHGYTVGDFYFLSDSVAGQATNVEPSSFSNPLFYVEDANTLQVKCLRPSVVGQDVVLDELSDVSAPSPTDGQALIYDNGNSRWEAKDIATSAADITYDNASSGLTATDSQAAIDEVEGRVDTLEAATVALDDLSDVSVAAPNEGEVLTYNSTSGDWESAKAPSSAINYIENNDFEVDTSGWTGDTNLVISRITSGQLRGDASLQIAKAAADASGEQVYVDFSVDTADLSKKLTISFDYDASDANYSDDDMRILIIKDPAGTPVTIRVNGEDLKGGKGTHIAQFQTDATITDYRLVIEQVSTQALAADIVIDNIQVGPREVVKGAAMTDWEDFTPSGTPSNGTLTVSKYKRIGDTGHFNLKWNTTAGFGSVNSDDIILPGHSMDVSKLVATQTGERGRYPVGKWHFADLGSNAYTGIIEYREDSDSFTMRSDVGDTIPSPGSDTVTFEVSLPIQGWSSNAKMSEDLGGRDVELFAAGNSGEVITTNVTNIPFNSSIQYDTTGSWDGSTFTCPETGYYDIDFKIRLTSSNQPQIRLYLDGATVNGRSFIESTSTSFHNGNFIGVYVEKGQVLSLRSTSTITLSTGDSLHNIAISKRQSPQTILENETVAAIYTSDAGQVIGGSTITTLLYEDIVKDTHNAYNTSTGIYTAPVSGFYSVSASAGDSSISIGYTQTAQVIIRVNGTNIYKGVDSGKNTTSLSYVDASGLVYLEKGDEVSIAWFSQAGSTMASDSMTFSIIRQK